MRKWFKQFKNQYQRLANTKWGEWILFFFTFADASILPMPTSTFFLVFAYLDNRKIVKYLLLAVSGTLAGALTGYAFGNFELHLHGSEITGTLKFLISHIPGFSESVYDKIHLLYSRWNMWVLLFAAATPIPYGFFSITSGIFEIDIFSFLLATFIGQGLRFLVLAIAMMKVGTKIRKFIMNKLQPSATINALFVIMAILILNAF